MPSVARTLQLAPVACYLSANYISKRRLFGGALDTQNPIKIYNVYKILKKVYDNDPVYDGLQVRADYLFELCKKWAIAATAIVDGGGGGSISPVTPPSGGTSEFPIYIIETDFSTATEYNDTRIVGKNLIIFYNEINRYLIPGSEFAYTLTGVQILIPGFDATAVGADVNMVIEQVTAGQPAGGGGSVLLGYYYYGTTDFYNDLVAGTDAVPYQGTFGATIGQPMDITFPAAAVDPSGFFLVIKIPDSQDIEAVWANSLFNFGTIPDSVFRSSVNNGNGYVYYCTLIQYLFNGTDMTMTLSTT